MRLASYWIGLPCKVGDPNEEEYDRGYYLAGEKSGTLSFTAPDEQGDYEFRLFEDDGYTDIARSNVVRVQAGTTVPTPTPTTPSGVHHLGDRTLSNWEVPKSEGTEYTTTFSLTAVPASADLILDVFDTDYNNPVLVNGNSVGILCINTIEGWKQCTIKIPGSALRVGSNTLTIQSESRGGNYDDFMIRNIWVTPSSDAQPITPPHTTDAALVAYYPFDGDIRDYSGNGNDGTIHGATFVSGISGQALRFDGKGDYVSAPVDINPTVMPQMTITAWVRADNDSGTIVSHDDGGFDRTIDIDTRGGGKGWSAFSGSGVVGYSPVTIGEWVFLAAVYDQSAETVKLYVNGALISEEKGKLGSGWDYINIGKNPSCGDYFSGTVDEVMIYNYDLTESEVKSIYDGGEAPEEEESGYGDIKVTYISWEEVQEKYTVSYDETFKYDDDGDGANEATLYYKGENNLVMSSDDTDKDGKVDLIFHYDDEEFLMRAIRDTDGDGELDQILHFNREEEIIKVEKIRNE
ncbi:MAG: LamG-like jellyroll fold domain-containing protein [Euryarchaeota archaeon]|nr:LamG-like jellyroll fold domain-containing protein [Euryarchaeota archaeon]